MASSSSEEGYSSLSVIRTRSCRTSETASKFADEIRRSGLLGVGVGGGCCSAVGGVTVHWGWLVAGATTRTVTEQERHAPP